MEPIKEEFFRNRKSHEVWSRVVISRRFIGYLEEREVRDLCQTDDLVVFVHAERDALERVDGNIADFWTRQLEKHIASDPEEFELDQFEEEFEEKRVKIADPLAGWNRIMFHFNDKLYFWVLRPVSKGYRAVVPSLVRVGVKNFFTNITAPIRIVNSILQGKWKAADAEFARFLFNSTVGVLGFGNPAKKYPELDSHEEDFGQTLGAYGIGNGFYIVWPILGPSTLRDSVGLVGDFFLNPVSCVEPIEVYVGIRSYEEVNETSFIIGDYEAIKKAAIDPYEAFRDAYIQYRNSKVKK